jgi:hypothetical protein
MDESEEKKLKKQNEEEEKKTDKKRSDVYLLLVELLFGIIIGVSLTDYHAELVPLRFNFENAAILIAYITVLASFLAYFVNVGKLFHMNLTRFVFDLVLLYLYFQLIYSLRVDLIYYLAIFPWIFGIYVVWQYFDYREWGGNLSRRFSYSVPIFTGFLAIWIYYYSIPEKVQLVSNESGIRFEGVGNLEWALLGLVFFLVIGYRIASRLLKK